MANRTNLHPYWFLAALGTSILAVHPTWADQPAYNIQEVTVAGPGDGVCNVHTTDNANAPDHGSVLWFLDATAHRLGRLDLVTGKIINIDLPKGVPSRMKTRSMAFVPQDDASQGPCDLLVTKDGTLWFNDPAGNALGYLKTTPPYTPHLLTMKTPNALPMAFQLGADGKLYVELTAVDKIARVDPDTHAITEFAVPEAKSGIVGGAGSKPDGAHWFILMNTGKLLRFDYATAKMTLYAIPTPNATPIVIRAYDDGLWFSEMGASAVGHFDPATQKFSTITMPHPNSAPIGIIQGADGFLYTELSACGEIVRIDRKAGTVVGEFPLPSTKSMPDELKEGPDGALWVPEVMSGKLARLWLPSFGTDPGFPQGKR